ncbi:MAG: alpha-glucan family phosphorylase, partial [Burkholderiales bacterium]
LWVEVGHNPKAFLRRVDEKRLHEAAKDQVFLATYNRVLSAYDTYHNEPVHNNGGVKFERDDLVAYFCFEFGFHESLPIYSGGLGILAGDLCKAASDLRLPFVAVGLLYRAGYFSQRIDSEGNQLVTHREADFDDLPITPVLDRNGNELRVGVDLPHGKVLAKVWSAKAGHVTLYLLDTDIEENSTGDRAISYQLYGGDRHMRIKQELLLGVGGARALAALGLNPTIWHINEGHAAFNILERIRGLVEQGHGFATALEAVAVNTVFTTHTPVPAGHDHFPWDLIREYFHDYCTSVKISEEEFFALGRAHGSDDFDMTTLAIRGSRHQNGVSRIHGGVSSRICAGSWPQIEPDENPMGYVTNGVHVPTFLAQEWVDLFDDVLGYEWRNRLTNVEYWSRIDQIPDHVFWSVRQALKSRMLHAVRHCLVEQHARNAGNPAQLDRLLRLVVPENPNVLTIAFARRFVTYKRPALLFENPEWLREIVSDAQRPVLFIFAGKAHPADVPGQDLIRHIHHMVNSTEFEGRVLLLEGYDMALARRLVAGADLWLNNPIYPLEASGTSGMKAGINGALNLSVLDGWWAEGYNGKNGWAIKPSQRELEDYQRNKDDGRTLYELLQEQVIPLYYERSAFYSAGWVAKAKHSIASLLPRYNSSRMLGEYTT